MEVKTAANGFTTPPTGNDGYDHHTSGVVAPNLTDPGHFSVCTYGINGNNDNRIPPAFYFVDGSACGGAGDQFTSTPFGHAKLVSLKTADLVFIYDGNYLHAYSNLAIRISNRHGGTQSSPTARQTTGYTNVLFFDGHAESLPRKQLPWYVNSTVEADMQNSPSNANAAINFQNDAAAGGFPHPFWRVDQ